MKTLILIATTLMMMACGGGGGSTADTGNASQTTPTTATQIQFGNGTFGVAKFSQ